MVPNGTATHNLTMYKTPSGARVFGAGTVQWAFGLDSPNPGGGMANLTMQQATLNLFADMGAFPVTPIVGPVDADGHDRHDRPDGDGQHAGHDGRRRHHDDDHRHGLRQLGGQVAGVEVTTDGGATWHPATSGTTSWTYTWVAHGAAAKIQARATDDSGNIGAATAAKNGRGHLPVLAVRPNVTPKAAEVDGGDASPIEVGFKFQSDTYGTVKGVTFYKATANTGTHIGNLWAADGTRLASATFTGESASGWQTVTFSSPVQVSPNTTYVASYYAPDRPLLGDQRLLVQEPGARPQRRRDRRRHAAARGPRHLDVGQRPLRLRWGQRVPDEHLRRAQLLGRRRLRGDARTQPGHRRDRAGRRQDLGHRQVDVADHRRPDHLLQDHPVRRHDGQARDDDRRHRGADAGNGDGPDHGHHLHLHGDAVQPRRRRGRSPPSPTR